MKIQLNGETRECSHDLTVETLVSELALDATRVAIEVNLKVVRRNEWATTVVRDGDRVEIVHFVGGGCD